MTLKVDTAEIPGVDRAAIPGVDDGRTTTGMDANEITDAENGRAGAPEEITVRKTVEQVLPRKPKWKMTAEPQEWTPK
jgi:hypothetical protein